MAGLACLACLPDFAAGGVLESPETRLTWPADSRAVTAWEVRSASDDKTWRSLVSINQDGEPISRHLRARLPNNDWQPAGETSAETDSGRIERIFISADGAWRLHQELQLAGDGHRIELTLELERLAPGATSPERSMQLMIGPGLGEIPLEGLGIATGLYSFVESVARVGDTTHRFRLEQPGGVETLEIDDWHGDDWVGLNSRYFALLLSQHAGAGPDRLEFGLAESPQPDRLPDRYLPWAKLSLPLPQLAAGETARWRYELFSGPKSTSALEGQEAGSYTELLFHGLWRWMRALAFGLLRVLELLHALVPSWGLAICLLAVLVRAILYPLARWALASQQRFSDVQRAIQPEIRAIKQRYKGGEESERILQLYKKHGVSPLAGLKPLLIVLIQIPVFVALFHVLGQAYELKDASFLWIDSLAEPDRLFRFGLDLPFFGAWFNLLPVLMALTTLVTIKLSPAPAADDAERRRQNLFLVIMAVAFFLLFYPFPSGMVLYWTLANLLHIAQARLFRPAAAKPAQLTGHAND